MSSMEAAALFYAYGFWRNGPALTVDDLAREQHVAPVHDLGDLADDDATDDEIEAFFAAAVRR